MNSRDENAPKEQAVARGFSRPLALLATVTLFFAAVFSAWRFLAAQSPSSPIHVGPLLGPVESLATGCWIAGFGGIALSMLFAALPDTRQKKRALYLLMIGWILIFAALLTGAILGTNGVQVIKAYPRTIVVVFIKLSGFLSTLAGLFQLLFAILKGKTS